MRGLPGGGNGRRRSTAGANSARSRIWKRCPVCFPGHHVLSVNAYSGRPRMSEMRSQALKHQSVSNGGRNAQPPSLAYSLSPRPAAQGRRPPSRTQGTQSYPGHAPGPPRAPPLPGRHWTLSSTVPTARPGPGITAPGAGSRRSARGGSRPLGPRKPPTQGHRGNAPKASASRFCPERAERVWMRQSGAGRAGQAAPPGPASSTRKADERCPPRAQAAARTGDRRVGAA